MPERKQLLLVDDDYAYTMHLASHLHDVGYDVTAVYSLSDAISVIEAPSSHFDIAIIDVYLPTDHTTSTFQIEGLNLATLLRQSSPRTRLVLCSGFISPETVERMTGAFDVCVRKPISFDRLNSILEQLDDPKTRTYRPNMFIVHGHDDATKLELKNYLQNTLNLGEPIILHEQQSLGRTIIEKFEDIAEDVDLVFVLLTPDDISGNAHDRDNTKRRARQNVILECGFFLGKLQRRSGRVMLLHKGDLELPSDISGIIYIDISDGIVASGEEIRRELSPWLG